MLHKEGIWTPEKMQISEHFLKVEPWKVTLHFNNAVDHFCIAKTCTLWKEKRRNAIITWDCEELRFTNWENAAVKWTSREGEEVLLQGVVLHPRTKDFVSHQWCCWDWFAPLNWFPPKSSSGIRTRQSLPSNTNPSYVLSNLDIRQCEMTNIYIYACMYV